MRLSNQPAPRTLAPMNYSRRVPRKEARKRRRKARSSSAYLRAIRGGALIGQITARSRRDLELIARYAPSSAVFRCGREATKMIQDYKIICSRDESRDASRRCETVVDVSRQETNVDLANELYQHSGQKHEYRRILFEDSSSIYRDGNAEQSLVLIGNQIQFTNAGRQDGRLSQRDVCS